MAGGWLAGLCQLPESSTMIHSRDSATDGPNQLSARVQLAIS